ncbi:hypothetical protein BSKO_01275 [Bryopsis sp. KO-2023]|nr:hypothetical protein BSKO_01275 [Bryopsis sp. KO-2023]
MEADGYWWPGFRQVSDCKLSVDDAALELLEKSWEKLLQGCQFFKGPDAACKRAISSDTEQVKLMGKLRKLDKSLSGSTDRISEMLGLNEIQSYCLLKQFAKSNEVDSKHLTSLTGDQLDEIQTLYMTERQALLRCVQWAMQLRKECESSGSDVGRKLREKLDKMVEKGWGQNILKDLKYVLTNHFETAPSGPATLGDAELDLLLEILTLYYQTDPPDSKEIVDLVESLNKFGLGAMLEPTPRELCTKVWHLFMYALDFPAMLDFVLEEDGGNPHRLISSLKEIDTEVQELMKCKNNIAGVVMMAWALFIGMEKRGRLKKSMGKTGSEKRARTTENENTVDPLVYFSAFGQKYVFDALGMISEVARELPDVQKNVLEAQVVMTIAAVIVVAEKLLSSREALDHIIKLLIPILEGQGASSCGGSITRDILSNPRYASILDLFYYLQSWFPAIPSPYLKFLGALCGENMISSVVNAFKLPSVTFEHGEEDRRVRKMSGPKVEALHAIDEVDYMQIEQGTQGYLVHSPVRLESKMLVKWQLKADIFHLMEEKLHRTMSRENVFAVFDKDCQEAADMFRLFKRTMDSPKWMEMFRRVTELSETDNRSFHLKWLSLALNGVEWFAERGNVESLADCISIMSSYAPLLPSQVWNAVLRSKFLCPSPAAIGGRYINSLLEGVWCNPRYVGVVGEFVKLTGNLIKQGILGHHVKTNAAMIIDKVLLGGGGGGSIDSDLTKDVLNMVIVILTTKWCCDDGFSHELVSHMIHRRGVFQLLLDGTLPQPFRTAPDQQSEQENRRLAAAQLNFINTLLAQDAKTQQIVAETLLQPVHGGQTVRFVVLLSYLCLPKEDLVPDSVEVLVHSLNQQLGVEIWAKLLAIMPSKAILLESLMPGTVDDQDFGDSFPDIRETVCQAFQQTNAIPAQNLFSSVIDLLIQAARHHRPTFQILLLPSKLQPECTNPSALDGLLNIVKDSKRLLDSHPRVVYDCIRGIHCIWTHRRDWPPPVSLLTVQQGFWQSLTHILKDSAKVNANKYRAASTALVLEMLAMESEDGWSGESGAEAKKLWTASGGESQWTLLRNAFSSCAMPSDPTVSLLSAANEVALDILQQMDVMDPDTRIPLSEKLEGAARQDLIDMRIPDAQKNALAQLRHSAGRDPHQRPGHVLLTELNAGLDIWNPSSDAMTTAELTEHRANRVVPPSLSHHSESMELLWKLLKDARWLNSMLCSKIAGLTALHRLAFSHWTDPSGSVSLHTKSTSVTSTSQAIIPWLEISKGSSVGLRPPVVFSGQVLPIQESDIKRKAMQIAQSLAASLLFFVQEWCDGITPPRAASKSRTRSPTPRARSRSGSLARQDSRVEDLSHIGAIDAVFRCVGATLEGIHSKSMRMWIGAAKDTIGAILSTVATILVEYPFRSRGGQDGPKQLPGEVQGALGKDMIAGLCRLVDQEEEPVTAAIVTLGLLLQYDVWPEETLIVLRQNLDLQGLLAKAMQYIPTFAQKNGKECPRGHWSSAALGFCRLVAERSFVSNIFLLPETLKTLVQYGKRLLHPEIGGLGTPDVMLDANAPDGQETEQADFRGAYDAETGTRKVEHEQWLMFLAVMECILRNVGRKPPNFEANLMAEFQCAMLKAFEVPFANHIEPLTHAQLQETISALRFLSAGWKSCNPVSLLALRKAVAHFVDCCGSGHPSPSSFYCPPVSFEEQAASRERSPIGGHYGWFYIFAIGERIQGNDSETREEAAADSGSQGQRAMTPPLARRSSSGGDAFQTPRHLVLNRRGSSQNIGRSDGRVMPDQVKSSQYSFMLGHSMYTCLNLALEFLLSSTPSVSCNEASAVCPGVSKESLLELRQECLDLGTNVSHWEMEDQQVAQVMNEVRDIVRMATELLVVLGHTPRRRETERIETSLANLDRCLEECRS